jgi:hypothetical protein
MSSRPRLPSHPPDPFPDLFSPLDSVEPLRELRPLWFLLHRSLSGRLWTGGTGPGGDGASYPGPPRPPG